MPGSLLSRVRRSNSARSDRSDISARSGDSCKSSGKKVSFNKAVRVKKFPRRTDAILYDDTNDADEKRFWFRVYKNSSADGSLLSRRDYGNQRTSGSDREEEQSALRHPLDSIDEIPRANGSGRRMHLTSDVGVGTSGDALHPSQQSETPTVRRNHVRKLVTRFNGEAVLRFPEDGQNNGLPPEPPVDYSEGTKRRNPLVNGVKVIFGNLKSKKKDASVKPSSVFRNNQTNLKNNLMGSNEKEMYEGGPPYRTSIVLADEYARSRNNNNNIYGNYNQNLESGKSGSMSRRNNNLVPASFWDSGDQLILDTTRFESLVDQNDRGGETRRTVEEGNKIWKHETRTIYEELPPVLSEQRRAKSHGDLRGDTLDTRLLPAKGLSIDDLANQLRRSPTRDFAVQCNRSREPSSTLPELHHVIRPSRNGLVSAYSNVPTLRAAKTNGFLQRSSTPPTEAVYSQVNKNKQSSRKSASTLSLNIPSSGSKIKSSQKSFGFRLKKAFGATLPAEKENTYVPAKDVDGNWYDVDADVEAASERAQGHHDISEVRNELEEEKSTVDDTETTGAREAPGSVVKGLDHRKREISYENTVTRSKPEPRLEASGGGLWYRGAEEDYRREMAQSDVSYPSGTTVGSVSTLGRAPISRLNNPIVPKSHTLDQRRFRSKSPTNMKCSPIKILLNGQEVDEMVSHGKHRRSESGEGRGGLAAAYKARQKAALRRSNSLSGSRLSVSGLSSGASSSAGASSDGELSRRTLVMYIPGCHAASDSDDRRSGVSRTQSLHTASRPPKYQKHIRKGVQNARYSTGKPSNALPPASEEADTLSPLRSETKIKKGDLRRRHSMPKDTKFSWFKWKIRGRSRET